MLVGLHGWGANAQDLAALANYLRLPDYQMFFPNAPIPHPQNPVGFMWYALEMNYSFCSDPNFDHQPELIQSRQLLTDWLRSLPDTTGIPLEKTILAGFSQGGAMTLDVGTQLPLAGLMSLSGYLHTPLSSPPQPIAPLLMVHGRYDSVVPPAAARDARDQLQQHCEVEYHELDMAHDIIPAELDLMQHFVEQRVTAP